MAEENYDNLILDEDFDLDVGQEVSSESQNKPLTQENIDTIQITKNTSLLFFKFIGYTTLYIILITIIFLQIFTYKNFERILLIPIALLFIQQAHLIIKTIQKNSIQHMEITDKGFSLTDNKNTFFIDFDNIGKVEIHTHRYTHFGMYKILSITTIHYKTHNIIFKVDYDEDEIVDRIRCRLKNHDIRTE